MTIWVPYITPLPARFTAPALFREKGFTPLSDKPHLRRRMLSVWIDLDVWWYTCIWKRHHKSFSGCLTACMKWYRHLLPSDLILTDHRRPPPPQLAKHPVYSSRTPRSCLILSKVCSASVNLRRSRRYIHPSSSADAGISASSRRVLHQRATSYSLLAQALTAHRCVTRSLCL